MIKNNLRHLVVTEEQFYEGLPVNASSTNKIYVGIVEKAYRELCLILARYHRVVLVRLDLHNGSGNPLGVDMTKFCRSFSRKLESGFESKVAYQWVRESGRSEHNMGVHWHLWVAIKCSDQMRPNRQAAAMREVILGSWEDVASGGNDRNHGSGWFYLQRSKLSVSEREQEQKIIADGGSGVLINMSRLKDRTRNNSFVVGGVVDECFYAISYLAKVYTKVRTPAGAGKRTFGNSNLNTKHKSADRSRIIDLNLAAVREDLSSRVCKALKISES